MILSIFFKSTTLAKMDVVNMMFTKIKIFKILKTKIWISWPSLKRNLGKTCMRMVTGFGCRTIVNKTNMKYFWSQIVLECQEKTTRKTVCPKDKQKQIQHATKMKTNTNHEIALVRNIYQAIKTNKIHLCYLSCIKTNTIHRLPSRATLCQRLHFTQFRVYNSCMQFYTVEFIFC